MKFRSHKTRGIFDQLRAFWLLNEDSASSSCILPEPTTTRKLSLCSISTKSWRRMGTGCINSCFLNFGTSLRRVVSFTHWQLYRQGNSSPPPQYPLDTRLGGHDRRSGRYVELNILDPAGTQLRPLGCPARSQSLYRLRYRGWHLSQLLLLLKRV
jgi:hypothetical protein